MSETEYRVFSESRGHIGEYGDQDYANNRAKEHNEDEDLPSDHTVRTWPDDY